MLADVDKYLDLEDYAVLQLVQPHKSKYDKFFRDCMDAKCRKKGWEKHLNDIDVYKFVKRRNLLDHVSVHPGHEFMVRNGLVNVLKFENVKPIVRLIETAIRHDQVECLRYFMEHPERPEINGYWLNSAVRPRAFQCLKMCVEEFGIEIPSFVYIEAINEGNLAMVKYIHSTGCRPTASSFLYSVDMDLSILKFCTANCDVTLHEGFTRYAALIGDIQKLRWLHEIGCPWNEQTVYEAIGHDQFECMHFAIKKNCPFELQKARRIAVHNKSFGCLWYILNKPLPETRRPESE